MSQQLVTKTLTNLLTSLSPQHKFTPSQISTIIQSILSTQRSSSTIYQQLQSIVKSLQEHRTISQSSNKKTFTSYEIEWIMNWLVENYYSHVKLIEHFEREFCCGRDQNEGSSRSIREDKQGEEGNQMKEIELFVDVPTFVEPLSKARVIREGGGRILVSGEDFQQETNNSTQPQQQ